MWRPVIEAAPPGVIQMLQSKRLQALVKRLVRKVPFYRQLLNELQIHPADIRGLNDLTRLPFTTKANLRDHYPLGFLAVPVGRICRVHATSGTRGKPTLVALTAVDRTVWAEMAARMLTASGCRQDQIWYVTSSYGLFTGGLGAHYGLERIGAGVVPASSGNSVRVLQLMSDIRPDGIHCIPSYMMRLAEVADSLGIEPRSLGLRFGSYGGEVWTEPMRRRIEETWGLTAYDTYGSSECYGPGNAYECEVRSGLHLNEDHLLCEVINPATGQPVPDGEEGELVVTTLTKQAMPLLRYRTGDLTRTLPGSCPCGRTLRRIDRIMGRCDDMLIIRGVNLYPGEVERLLLGFPEVGTQYRLIVERTGPMDRLTLEAELAERAIEAAPLAAVIAQRCKQALGLSAIVSLVPPGTLPRTEGKAVRVVDRRG